MVSGVLINYRGKQESVGKRRKCDDGSLNLSDLGP